MRLMPGNNASGEIHYYCGLVPDRSLFGHLWQPGRNPTYYRWLPYSLDNGRFLPSIRKQHWQERSFIRLIEASLKLPERPLWLTVPDWWRDRERTLREWQIWYPRLRDYSIPLAFVVQDEMSPFDVPEQADVIFIGGSNEWREQPGVIQSFMAIGKSVHVGRVPATKLWHYDKLGGINSVDSTGWFRSNHGSTKERERLNLYLRYRLGETGLAEDLEQAQFEDNPDLSPSRQQPQPQRSGLPRNITHDHLVQAIRHWQPVPKSSEPRRYAVSYEGQIYPIKVLIARANRYANGFELPVGSFSGGRDAIQFLKLRRMTIVELPDTQVI